MVYLAFLWVFKNTREGVQAKKLQRCKANIKQKQTATSDTFGEVWWSNFSKEFGCPPARGSLRLNFSQITYVFLDPSSWWSNALKDFRDLFFCVLCRVNASSCALPRVISMQ